MDDRIGSRDEELDHLYAEIERLRRVSAAWKRAAKGYRRSYERWRGAALEREEIIQEVEAEISRRGAA